MAFKAPISTELTNARLLYVEINCIGFGTDGTRIMGSMDTKFEFPFFFRRFHKIPKATIKFVMSVRLSPNRGIFMKFDI
jgi:hypothetical protein